MLSVHDVALQLKVTDQHIRSLLRKGELKAEMVGKQWIIQQDAVNQYIKEYNITIEPDDHPRRTTEIPNIIALSFFSGAMGLDIRMEQGGIKALLTTGLMPRSSATYLRKYFCGRLRSSLQVRRNAPMLASGIGGREQKFYSRVKSIKHAD